MITKIDTEMFRRRVWKVETHVICGQKVIKGQEHRHKNFAGVGICILVSAGFF